MQSEIIVAALSLSGTFLGSFSGLKLMSYRIAQLEKKVERLGNFAERVPILEEKMAVANHRIGDLENTRKEEWHEKCTGKTYQGQEHRDDLA